VVMSWWWWRRISRTAHHLVRAAWPPPPSRHPPPVAAVGWWCRWWSDDRGSGGTTTAVGSTCGFFVFLFFSKTISRERKSPHGTTLPWTRASTHDKRMFVGKTFPWALCRQLLTTNSLPLADLEGGPGRPWPTLRFSPRVINFWFFFKKVWFTTLNYHESSNLIL
jgi:hypothetical protein